MTRSYRWIAGGSFLIVLVLVLRWAWVPSTVSNERCRLTQNAAWISVDWTADPVDADAVARLAERATQRHLRYLFPFTTYVKADGTFSPSYEHAGAFTSTFREFNRETVLLAWIGIPLQNESRLGIQGTVDLSDEASRQHIVDFVAQLMQETAFDGVHLDVETVRNEDEPFLLLLEEVRAALDDDDVLSIAGSYWMPTITSHVPVVGGFRWDHRYYRAVASRVDQIAVMTYDSFLPHPALYRVWLREQVQAIGGNLSQSDVELLFGLSVSRERTVTHHPNAENMRSGLAGICAAVAGVAAPMQIADGVAVYAAWEAESEDWHLWETWIIPNGSSRTNADNYSPK